MSCLISFCLLQAGMMISIGNYSPSAILSPVDASSAPVATAVAEVDEFGRAKADNVALDPKHSVQALKKREDRRLMDRMLLSEQAERLSAADKELVIANRLADITSGASPADSNNSIFQSHQAALYQQLDSCSALYNNKGEKVDFVQRAAMLEQAAQAALADVEPSLCAVATIVQRLLEFKTTYPVEFEAAFIADSAVELFQPLILLDITPLATSVLTSSPANSATQVVSFETRPWYDSLVQFSSAVSNNSSMLDDVENDLYDEAPRKMGLGAGNSMAAQINNLFETGGQEGAESETVLTKVRFHILSFSVMIRFFSAGNFSRI